MGENYHVSGHETNTFLSQDAVGRFLKLRSDKFSKRAVVDQKKVKFCEEKFDQTFA